MKTDSFLLSVTLRIVSLLATPMMAGPVLTSAPPNYWCTWSTQGKTLRVSQKAGKIVFAGDQGAPNNGTT